MMTINENPFSLYHVYFSLYPTYLQPLQSLVSDAEKKMMQATLLSSIAVARGNLGHYARKLRWNVRWKRNKQAAGKNIWKIKGTSCY